MFVGSGEELRGPFSQRQAEEGGGSQGEAGGQEGQPDSSGSSRLAGRGRRGRGQVTIHDVTPATLPIKGRTF